MTKKSAQLRTYLDSQLSRLRLVAEDAPPDQGWIKAVREALGMSTTELGARLGVGQSTVSHLEHGETEGTIKLGSLRRAADALDCDVVYFLVPRTTLSHAVEAQSRRKAAQLIDSTGDNGLEKDVPDGDEPAAQIDELARKLADRRGLWSEVPTPG